MRSDSIPKIIVKTKYLKNQRHKEYYLNYIATRDGVEKFQMSHGDKPVTKKQQELIENLLKDYPDSKTIFEYEDYINEPTRRNASEFISAVMDQNLTDIATKENYVDYIANRPRVERLGEHGLFSDSGKKIDLSQVVQEVGKHEGTVWTHIISLKREDASRLGYDHAQGWVDLCRAKRNELAEAMRIDSNNLQWYAAFHNEGHHPHIHMVVYSKEPRQGFVTNQGIKKIRKMFASEIFHQDLMNIYKNQTEARDELKNYSQKTVQELLKEIGQKDHLENGIIIEKFLALKESLKDYQGRLMFAYIPKESKQLVNDIVRELEKEEHVQKLYEQWNLYRQSVFETYNGSLQEQLPLLEQKEFKSIKNMILKEVMNYDVNAVTYDEQLPSLQVPELDIVVEDVESEKVDDIPQNLTTNLSARYRLEWSKNYKMACKLFYGSDDVQQDIEQAKSLLKEECDQHNILGYELLAKVLEIENKENPESYDLYKEALQGSLEILSTDKNDFIQSYLQYKTGKFYYYGKGCEQDYEKAYHHFSQSDSEYAMYCLGRMYQRGYYVEQSDKTAFEYFDKSATKGNAFANYEVGTYYDRGTAVPKDEKQANLNYEIAYRKFEGMLKNSEDDNLLYRLGEMNYYGKGVEKDTESAKKYLEKAISFDNKNAKYLLATIYLKEYDYANIPQAIKWLEESENPQALYLLGKEYLKGILVEQDKKKAVHYLTLSAEQKNSYAMYALAKVFLNDINYMDPDKGISYLQNASSLGNEYAQIMLGNIYLKGERVEKNVDAAISYLQMASDKNNSFAQYMLGKLFLFGKEVEQDKEKAKSYLEQAAIQGNTYAMYLLEHMDDYHHQPLVLMTTRLLHHISRIFTKTVPDNSKSPLAGVDKKLAKKIKEKKIAQGHNAKDHEINMR